MYDTAYVCTKYYNVKNLYKMEFYNFKCLHCYKECKFNKHENKQGGKLYKT